jgi:hypothetical protein
MTRRNHEARLRAIEARFAAPVGSEELCEALAAMRATIPISEDAELEAVEAAAALPARWRPQRFHEGQAAAFHSRARFRAIECGRRSGKTEGRKREVVIRALDPDWPLDDRFIVVGAPTQQQTMRLYWRDLLKLIPSRFVNAVRKSEYEIELVNGAVIRCLGMDRPERAEGDPLDDLFLDEVADMRTDEVLEHLRPALDTTERPPGTLTAYGTTDMRSGEAFVKLCDEWRSEAERGDPSYSYHHWTSAGIVSPGAWEEARRTLDPAVFAVEYEARRVSTGNLAYYCFDRSVHLVRGLRLLPDRPVIVTLDWNWDPGTAVFAQEQCIGHYPSHGSLPSGLAEEFTAVLGEVFVRRTNTPAVLRSVLAWLESHGHRAAVHVHGDPAGGASGAAQVDGSNVDIVYRTLSAALGDRLYMRIARKAPAVIARLNAVNARLLAADQRVRMILDPDACPELVKDLEQVHLKEGAHHVEIDKPTSGQRKLRTHCSDALGYYVEEVFETGTRNRLVVEPWVL